MPRNDAVDVATFDLSFTRTNVCEDWNTVVKIVSHRSRVVQRRVFDFVAVRSKETRKIGDGPYSIVDVALIQEGKHGC